MKTRLFFVGVFLLGLVMTTSAQLIYYGYPPSKKIKKGDVIIVNLPKYIHSRFYETDGTTALYDFLNVNQDVKFNISINVFVDSPNYDLSISEHLKKSLEKMLLSNCIGCKYDIIAKGQTDPIFLTVDSPQYRMMNNRLEIVLSE